MSHLQNHRQSDPQESLRKRPEKVRLIGVGGFCVIFRIFVWKSKMMTFAAVMTGICLGFSLGVSEPALGQAKDRAAKPILPTRPKDQRKSVPIDSLVTESLRGSLEFDSVEEIEIINSGEFSGPGAPYLISTEADSELQSPTR